ncbi:MAG: glycosyltransferase family 4 protein [Deltaproteobacteria bacterium]
MRVVYVAPYLPREGAHGCAGKMHDELSVLGSRHRFDIVCFAASGDRPVDVRFSAAGCCVHPFPVDSYSRLPRTSPEMTRRIGELAAGADLLQCECSFMMRFLPRRLPVPVVLTEVQVYLLEFWRRFATGGGALSLARMLKNSVDERFWTARADRVVFLSGHDRQAFGFVPEDKARTIPLGVDLEYFRSCRPQKKYDACFLGNFLNDPNKDAMEHFFSRIYPEIKKQIPSFSFCVTGGGSEQMKEYIPPDGSVTVTGAVPDIRLFLDQSRLFLNPVRRGSGMRRKVIEAWAMSVPVVSTSAGCEGLDVRDGVNAAVADTPACFADRVSQLLADGNKRDEMGRQGRKTAEGLHDRTRTAGLLDSVYKELA